VKERESGCLAKQGKREETINIREGLGRGKLIVGS